MNVAIAPGAITSIAGPNAAGKSTLLKCIVGLVRPDAGEILIDGAEVSGDWRYRAKIGYAPQTPHFPEGLTTGELAGFLTRLRRTAAPNARELIELFELGPAMDRPLRELSGGTRQKISIVLAAMFDPPILVMDEPTAGLDPLMKRRQKQWLLKEKARGKTVLMASHLMAELEELCDRIVFLLDGRLFFDGAPAQARAITAEGTLDGSMARMIEAHRACAAR